MTRLLIAPLLCLALTALGAGNPDEGRRLAEKAKCEGCHASKVAGGPGAIYLRKDRKVTSIAKLKAQVGMCNSQLNLGLFPEDEEHVAAYLNRDFYKFPGK